MIPYNIRDWYWLVGDSSPTTQVWASARATFVPLNDVAYQEWLQSGGGTTVIDTAANLQQVFSVSNFPQGWPGGDAVGILAAGCTVQSSTRTYLNGLEFALDPLHITYNEGVEDYLIKNGTLPGGVPSVPVATTSGPGVLVLQADVSDLFSTLADFVTEVQAAARLKAMFQPATYPTLPMALKNG